MNNLEFEALFTEYYEGFLKLELREKLEKALNENQELYQSYQEFKNQIALEKNISESFFELHPNFSVKVLNRINQDSIGFFQRYIMKARYFNKFAYGSMALIAVGVVALVTYQNSPRDQSFSSSDIEELATNQESAGMPKQETPSQSKIFYNDMRPAEGGAIAGVIRGLDGLISKSGKREISQPAQAPEALSLTYEGFDGAQGVIENREKYLQHKPSSRIMVSDQATSTFSIDVDTGSYTNARRFLSQGQLPPADAIRTEEFINYFDYNYPKQSDKPFSFNYEIAPAPLNPDRFLLKLGIKARDAKELSTPWNLTFLVDVSGSMQEPNKLPLLKRSLKLLVNNMRAEDKMSLVTYAGQAGVVIEGASIKDKDKMLSAIDQLDAGGSTAGSAGIETAYSVTEKHKVAGVNRVILTTDGDFNVGITSHEELLKLISKKRASNITLTTIGFGDGNYQEATMEQLANKGNGNYYYIDGYQEARKLFTEQLAGMAEVVAKDVKLQIEFNPAHVKQYRLIGYDNRTLANHEFNDDQIDAGEIGLGHTVTALYEIVLTDSKLAKELSTDSRYAKEKAVEIPAEKLPNELAFLKVRFKAPNADKSELLEFPIEKVQVKKSADLASVDFNFAASVFYFAEKLRGLEFASAYSYQQIEQLAEKNLGADTFGYRREFLELVRNVKVQD